MNERFFYKAKQRLDDVMKRAHEVKAVNQVRKRALRLLEVHPVHAADACQLASALVATQEDPRRLAIICFDQRLKNAALKEGFRLNPGQNEIE